MRDGAGDASSVRSKPYLALTLEEFLALHDADVDLVMTGAHGVAALEHDDVLLAVGSLAEGLGTRKSDVDLVLISPRDDLALASPDEVLSWVAGKCIIDMRIAPKAQIAALNARLDDWARTPWSVTRAADFTANEVLLLHRLSAGNLLWPAPGAAAVAELRPSPPDVARLKLHVARHMARTVQVDMVGYRDAGDCRSLVFAAQELLGHAVDGLLAGYRLTNPTPKWRSRLLDLLPADWQSRLLLRPTGESANELVWRLHRAPEAPSRSLAVDHACRIATFARAVFLWAECELILQDDFAGSDPHRWAAMDGPGAHPALPFLELDVDFQLGADGVTVARLNELGAPLRLSFADFVMLMLFDNHTSAREAASVAASMGVAWASESLVHLLAQMEGSGLALASSSAEAISASA